MIEMGKKYRTRNGRSVRLLCTDAKSLQYPVIALILCRDGSESVECFTHNGFYSSTPGSPSDLIEITLWDGFELDEPVLVKQYEDGRWIKRHFAGVNDDGMPTVFMEGKTSWTCGNSPRLLFDQCVRPPKDNHEPS